MFCINCGSQLPDNAKFCSNCGAQLFCVENVAPAPEVAPNTQEKTPDTAEKAPATAEKAPATAEKAPATAEKTPNATEKTPKKKTGILLIAAIVVAAFLIGKFAIAPALTPKTNDRPSAGSQSSQSQQSSGNNSSISANTDNPAYTAIFNNTYIVHFQSFFNMETKNFASKQADGIIACADYGYEDDVVKKWVETLYVPVSEYTDAQKAEVETTFKTQFASIDALNCCVVTYKMSTNYFTITCTYSDVDQASNYAELYSAGILQTNTFISMSATETSLLSQGFIKK